MLPKPNRAKEEGDEEVSERSVEMTRFQIFAFRDEPELALSWAGGVARDGRNEKNGSDAGSQIYNRW